MKKLTKYTFLMGIGGITYMLIEFAWRGYSHWSSFILGSIAFTFIGCLNEFDEQHSIVCQMICGGMFITLTELLMGIFVNIILQENAWDYSNMWGNLLGQICPLFSFIWCILSFVAIVFDDILRWIFFKEPFPHYRWR